MLPNFYLDRDNLDFYLTALGKEYKKLSKHPVQIVLVGGGAIFIRYSFRMMSLDLDGLLYPYKSDSLKHAIRIVADKHNIPYGWLNDDFIKTDSYSNNIFIYSEYYKTYSNLIEVRIIDSIHLIAMKLKSFRSYKRDQSDIVGILLEEKHKGNFIKIENIKKAYIDLYKKEPSKEECDFLIYLYSKQDKWETLFHEVIIEEDINKTEISKINNNVEQKTALKQSIIDLLLKKQSKK